MTDGQTLFDRLVALLRRADAMYSQYGYVTSDSAPGGWIRDVRAALKEMEDKR